MPSSASLEQKRKVILASPDYCADCACPLSADAHERAPKVGYIAFANQWERRASTSSEWVEHAGLP